MSNNEAEILLPINQLWWRLMASGTEPSWVCSCHTSLRGLMASWNSQWNSPGPFIARAPAPTTHNFRATLWKGFCPTPPLPQPLPGGRSGTWGLESSIMERWTQLTSSFKSTYWGTCYKLRQKNPEPNKVKAGCTQSPPAQGSGGHRAHPDWKDELKDNHDLWDRQGRKCVFPLGERVKAFLFHQK